MTEFVGSTIDDLMHDILTELVNNPISLQTSRAMIIGEIIGAKIILTNPLARLSRSETRGKPFSAIGELLWYLAQSDDLNFIKYYIRKYERESEDKATIYGAYGPRIFLKNGLYNQLQQVVDILKLRPTSRQAVIQIFDAEDISVKRKHVPCTCNLQFFVRNEKLQMITFMRSNDAYLGLPHDIFAFTMIQEIVARSVGVAIGQYTHLVGSLHLYAESKQSACDYLAEGLQSTTRFMPEMPQGDPMSSIKSVLEIEEAIRKGKAENENIDDSKLTSYWKDLCRLLLLYKYFKAKDAENIALVKSQMVDKFYTSYVDEKMRTSSLKANSPKE